MRYIKRDRILAGGQPLAIFLLLLTLCTLPTLADGSYLSVRQSVSPQEIYVTGTGAPDVATISVLVEGSRRIDRLPVDCAIVIDTSATAQIETSKAFALDLIDSLSEEDRISVVSFSTSAELVVPLTYNRLDAKKAIADLQAAGKSAFGDALEVARIELTENSRPDALLAQVLLTDGQSNILSLIHI